MKGDYTIMMIAYWLSGQDNGTRMYDFNDCKDKQCKSCNSILDQNYIPPKFKLTNTTFDVSYTYDGFCIVSLRFKNFCEKNKIAGAIFTKLPNDNSYVLTVDRILQIDTTKTKIEFGNHCQTCNTNKFVIISEPIIFKTTNLPIINGFYFTDLIFGDSLDRSPIIIIGVDTYKQMKLENFSKISFRKIETA